MTGGRGTLRYERLGDEDVRKFTISRAQSMKHLGAADGAPMDFRDTEETLTKLKKMGQFESMDYDPVDNEVEREVNKHRDHRDYTKAEMWKWGIAAAIGIVMGFVGFSVDVLIEKLNTFKFTMTTRFLRDGDETFGFWPPYLVYVGISTGLALIAGALVSYVEPLAAGSGIPELKTYLNGVHIRGLLQVKTFCAKIVGVLFSISSGLIAGKEGPFVHGGGIVGGGLGGMGSRTLTTIFKNKFRFKTQRSIAGYFRNDADHRDFTAIGTAAGVATAFAAPIGGLLFTIEEGCSFYSTSVLWRGFLSTSLGVLTLHFLVEAMEPSKIYEAKFGRYRDFGLYSDDNAIYGKTLYYYFWEIPIYMAMGAIFGLLGAFFVWSNVKITSWRHRFIPVKCAWKRMLEVAFVAFVTGTIGFTLCYVSPCMQDPSSEERKAFNPHHETDGGGATQIYQGGGDVEYFPRLWCAEGEYSVYGQLFYTPLSGALRLLMHLGERLPETHDLWEFDLGLLFIAFFYSYILMIWTYGIGAATGLFVPSLMVGAVGGRLVGRVVHLMLEVISPDGYERISLPAYAIIGAAASLGGATRMTISICVLVMETTGSLQLIVPIMVTVMVAKSVGDAFGLGIYDTHIEIRGAPILEEHNFDYHQRMVHDKLGVSELMSRELVCLPPVIKLTELAHILRSTTHGAFPISHDAVIGGLNKDGISLQGVVTRIQLLRMLQNRVGFLQEDEFNPFAASSGMVPASQQERLDLLERLEQVPLKIRAKADQEPILSSFTTEEMNKFVMDLRTFCQKHPFCVNAGASLSRAYHLFRTMGLRHLFVIPDEPKVVGLLTRKDVTKDNAKLVLGEKANTEDDLETTELLTRPTLPFLPLPALEEKGTAVTAEGITEPLLSPRSPYGRRVTFFNERTSRELSNRLSSGEVVSNGRAEPNNGDEGTLNEISTDSQPVNGVNAKIE